jgi:C4-dicarboxylate transporter
MKNEKELKIFISETANTIDKIENDIKKRRNKYDKKKSVIDKGFIIVLLLLSIVFIVGLYYKIWSCIIVSFVIGVFSYLYFEHINKKNLKVMRKKHMSLYKDLGELKKDLIEAQDKGLLPSSHQIHGEVM